jgi:hypothetical protein
VAAVQVQKLMERPPFMHCTLQTEHQLSHKSSSSCGAGAEVDAERGSSARQAGFDAPIRHIKDIPQKQTTRWFSIVRLPLRQVRTLMRDHPAHLQPEGEHSLSTTQC